MPSTIARMDQRLLTDRNIWLATVRSNGKPHLIPIWFVWVNERAYICTTSGSVKIRNITSNPNVSFSLEDGNKPLIGEALAALVAAPFPINVVRAFQTKYNWDITTDPGYDILIELTITKWRQWQV